MSGEDASSSGADSGSGGGAAIPYDYISNTNKHERSANHNLRISLLIDWGEILHQSTLHFSGTLLGSARGTGLLPVCGRNLYNYLCSFFLNLSCLVFFQTSTSKPLVLDCDVAQTAFLF